MDVLHNLSLLLVGLLAKSCPTLLWPHGLRTQFMRFSRQEYWSGLSFPFSGDLSDPGIKPTSPVSPAFAGRVLALSPRKANLLIYVYKCMDLGKELWVCVCVCVCVIVWKVTEVLCPFVEGYLCFHWHMGFHMVNMCLTSQEAANCFLKQLWSLLIISVASEFPVSPCSHPSSHLHVKFLVFLC